MTDELAGIPRDGITVLELDTIRLLRAYLLTDHAGAAEIIKSLDHVSSDRVCSDLVEIYSAMARAAEKTGVDLGWSTEEIHETFPRVLARVSGDTFALSQEQV